MTTAVKPPSPFEGEVYETPVMGYDSKASHYLTMYGFLYLTTPAPRKFNDFEDKLFSEMPYMPVLVGNEDWNPYGRLFICRDDSKLLQCWPREQFFPEHFQLFKLTGDAVRNHTYYIDFTFNPPVATKDRPELWDPTKPKDKPSVWLKDTFHGQTAWTPA